MDRHHFNIIDIQVNINKDLIFMGKVVERLEGKNTEKHGDLGIEVLMI